VKTIIECQVCGKTWTIYTNHPMSSYGPLVLTEVCPECAAEQEEEEDEDDNT